MTECKHDWILVDPHDSNWDKGWFECGRCKKTKLMKYRNEEDINRALEIAEQDIKALLSAGKKGGEKCYGSFDSQNLQTYRETKNNASESNSP